jgi:hypothetical protein
MGVKVRFWSTTNHSAAHIFGLDATHNQSENLERPGVESTKQIAKMERSCPLSRLIEAIVHNSSGLRKAHQNKIFKRWLSKHTMREQTILNGQQKRRRRNLVEDTEARTSALIPVC